MTTIVEFSGRRAGSRTDSVELWAAGLTAYAGVLHLYAAPEHLSAWWGYGAFFIAVGLAQLVFAGLLVRYRSPVVMTVGVVVTVGIVALYAVSRTRGIPLGPPLGHSGTHRRPERVELLDLACVTAEVISVGLMVSVMPARHRRRAIDLCFVAGMALWCARLFGQLAG